jgi:hypothetical protein
MSKVQNVVYFTWYDTSSAATDMQCQMTGDITMNNEARKERVMVYLRVLLLFVSLLLNYYWCFLCGSFFVQILPADWLSGLSSAWFSQLQLANAAMAP